MPTDTTKRVPQLLELPPGLTDDQLQTTLNDRIRDLNGNLAGFVQNPAMGPVDLGTQQITNLADPKNDLDGVNLRTLKKFAGTGPTQQVAGSGTDSPTIYFTFDGLPFDGEISPFAIIMANRAGFTPVSVSVSTVGPAIGASLFVNLLIAGVPMLKADLELVAGQQGPATSSAFALGGSLALGTLIQAIITKASSTSQVTIGLSIGE